MSGYVKKKSGLLQSLSWVGASRLIVRLLGLCSTLVLARLLVPEDFGLVAVATGIIGLLETFTEFSFNQALIRFQESDDDDYATAWTLNCCRGVILALIVIAISYPVSLLLKDSRLFLLLASISVLPMIRGFETPRLIIFEKKIEFNVIFRIMVFTKTFGVITTISLAFLWGSYWVFVAGMVVAASARTLLSYYYAPGKLKFTFVSTHKLFGFSGWLLGSQMLLALGNRMNPVILAAFVAPSVVGIFHIARELSSMTFMEVAGPLVRVMFPVLSNISDLSTEFVDIYKQSISGIFMVLSPICIGFALIANEAVPVMLGDQWGDVVVPLQYILVALAFSTLGLMARSAAMAKGYTRLIFFGNLISTPIKLSLFCLGAVMYGLIGAVIAVCIGIFISTVINIYIGSRVTFVSFFEHFSLVKRSIIPLLLMCLAVLLAQYYISDTIVNYSNLLNLLFLILVGASVYIVITYCLWVFLDRPDGTEKKAFEILNKSKLLRFKRG
jgi:lipopolysaccharide exporter